MDDWKAITVRSEVLHKPNHAAAEILVATLSGGVRILLNDMGKQISDIIDAQLYDPVDNQLYE